MTELTWEFEVDKDADGDAIAAEIERRLRALDGVGAVEAAPPEERRFGVEVVAVVLAAVTIVRSGRELTEEVTKMVRAVRELATEIKGVRDVFLDRDGERVPLAEVIEAGS